MLVRDTYRTHRALNLCTHAMNHYMKERMHVRHLIQYMDDGLLIVHDRTFAEECLEEITCRVEDLGFTMNEKKTHIQPLSEKFAFLGFRYQISDAGKVRMTLDSENVRHERKKLRRLANRAKEGLTTEAKMDECYQSWKANAAKGDSDRLFKRMDGYISILKEEIHEAHRSKDATERGTGVCKP